MSEPPDIEETSGDTRHAVGSRSSTHSSSGQGGQRSGFRLPAGARTTHSAGWPVPALSPAAPLGLPARRPHSIAALGARKPLLPARNFFLNPSQSKMGRGNQLLQIRMEEGFRGARLEVKTWPFPPSFLSPRREYWTPISRHIVTYSHPKSFGWQINFSSL